MVMDVDMSDGVPNEPSLGMVTAALIGGAVGGVAVMVGAAVAGAHLPIPVDPSGPVGQILGQGLQEAANHGVELGAAAGVATYTFVTNIGSHVERGIDKLFEVGILHEMSEEERNDYDARRLPIEGRPGSIVW